MKPSANDQGDPTSTTTVETSVASQNKLNDMTTKLGGRTPVRVRFIWSYSCIYFLVNCIHFMTSGNDITEQNTD
jgi:hypothetical protein